MTMRERLIGTNGTKGILERSGIRAFLSLVIIVIVNAWSQDADILLAVKERANEMVGLLLVALGLTASRSERSTPKGEEGDARDSRSDSPQSGG